MINTIEKNWKLNGASSVLSILFLLVLEGRSGQAVAVPFAWRPDLRAAPISRKIQVSDADGKGRCNRADLIILILSFFSGLFLFLFFLIKKEIKFHFPF